MFIEITTMKKSRESNKVTRIPVSSDIVPSLHKFFVLRDERNSCLSSLLAMCRCNLL